VPNITRELLLPVRPNLSCCMIYLRLEEFSS
jgi:hypothetical protein